ncbi:hypothetical protein [Candidatus Chloroploca asiatica]|uniref:hypothetical protein n=1 Tax=Candidatus Chloroploca asiatica TaxID=1506545 RepID=UPI001144E6AC|nr:hypothetical protein [Candidatus Chloroploca asiatica]
MALPTVRLGGERMMLAAAKLGDRLELPSQRVNLLLAELGWIERKGSNWYPTPQGQALGARPRSRSTNGTNST